jgi:TRAP-type mannitol/chloroaromatic compound transport system substrate-binding protein
MPPAEIFSALQNGTLDGAEWVGPSYDLNFGFHKIMTHMYTPSFSDIHGGIEYGVNKKAYDSLEPELQTILQVSAEAETALLNADSFYSNAIAFEKLKAMPNVTIGQLPDSIWKALREATTEVMEELRATDKMAAKIHDSFYGFAKKASELRTHYELPFYRQRASYYG